MGVFVLYYPFLCYIRTFPVSQISYQGSNIQKNTQRKEESNIQRHIQYLTIVVTPIKNHVLVVATGQEFARPSICPPCVSGPRDVPVKRAAVCQPLPPQPADDRQQPGQVSPRLQQSTSAAKYIGSCLKELREDPSADLFIRTSGKER